MLASGDGRGVREAGRGSPRARMTGGVARSFAELDEASREFWAGASVAAAVSLVDSGLKYRLIPRIGSAIFVVPVIY